MTYVNIEVILNIEAVIPLFFDSFKNKLRRLYLQLTTITFEKRNFQI